MLCREWRCSWSSADRRCSNYIWVIDNFIAYQGATYIRGFMVTWIWPLGANLNEIGIKMSSAKWQKFCLILDACRLLWFDIHKTTQNHTKWNYLKIWICLFVGMLLQLINNHVSANLAPKDYFDGLVKDCSISIANALEILPSCTKSSI